MKKIIVLIVAVLMLMVLVFALAEAPVCGGWAAADSTELTEERLAVFDKAMTGLVGVDYEPTAYLGNQVVAGQNHCFLCKVTVVYPDAEPYFALVYIYEDLEGGATVRSIAQLDLAAFANPAEAAE